MSDFDKEAERERLREKYEHDQTKREATEQMSELLLKGATMTNAHCSQCGDPIFRYDGQEFCPTCEKAVERDTGGDADGEGADGDGADGDAGQDSIEVTDPSEGARVAFGADAARSASEQDATEQGPAERGSEAVEDDTPDTRERTGSHPPRQREPAAPSGPEPTRDRQPPSSGDGIAAARESLVRALARFSEQAAATDDPRRAEDHLAAAREAAEALDALDR